jgi:tRNA-specific 2-thiouridylase
MLLIIKIVMSQNNRFKVFLGLSGGVDSAVAGHLLLEQGYDVEAVFMQNWDDTDNDYCTSDQDLADALNVAKLLGIPFRVVNFASNYWEDVFERFLDAHQKGYTPNPDILCNSEVKFKHFLTYALENGADFIATGHYAGIDQSENSFRLVKPVDDNKDQTYFLHALNQYQLSKSIFPLANLTKPQIREIALKLDLPVATKKDSTGICFIGNNNYNKFISEYMLARPGVIKSTTGDYIGKHSGLIYYTNGQRKGIGKGGDNNNSGEPWYVVGKNIEDNELIVAQGKNNPALFKQELRCDSIHWINPDSINLPIKCTAKIRYRQIEQSCIVSKEAKCFRVVFSEPQRAVTQGQYVVFYLGSECIGGGVITE